MSAADAFSEWMRRVDERIDTLDGNQRIVFTEALNSAVRRIAELELQHIDLQARFQAWSANHAVAHGKLEAKPTLSAYPCPYCTWMGEHWKGMGLEKNLFLNHHNLEHCPHRIRMQSFERGNL